MLKVTKCSHNRSAAAIKCNVTDFDQQVEMFELAMKKYGSVDIVVCQIATFPAWLSKQKRFYRYPTQEYQRLEPSKNFNSRMASP